MLNDFEQSTCHKCKNICLENSIFCDLCRTWLHAKCVKFTDQPYFCSSCLSSEIPFANVTNTHIDTFNSLDTITHILSICTECHKEINHKDQLKCKLGNHFIHKKCSNSKLNDNNHSTWSCKNCKLFPFDDLNDNDLIENLLTANPEQVKRKTKIKLINRIEELKTILPNIEIPDPINDDP
eukprot:TCONS_00038219-protein